MAKDDTKRAKKEPPTFQNGTIGPTIVTVLVGPDRTLFSVHKDLICHHSPYFDAAFNGPFKESSDGQITLEEAAPFTFGLFLHWLYTGLVPFAKDADNDDDDDDKEKEEADDDEDEAQPPSVDESGLEHVQGSSGGVETDADSEQKARSGARETALDVRLTPLYVFAERYDAPVLKNAVMNALLDHFTDDDETYPWYASVLEAFEGLPDTNPLRRLYTELYAYRFTGREPAGELDSIPLLSREFTYGVMSLMAKIRNGTGEHEPDYASFDTWCSYHAHVDEAEKIACAYFVPDTGSDNGGIVEVISDEE